jgi:hypothetical protein
MTIECKDLYYRHATKWWHGQTVIFTKDCCGENKKTIVKIKAGTYGIVKRKYLGLHVEIKGKGVFKFHPSVLRI